MFSFWRALLISTLVLGFFLTGFGQVQDKEQSKAMFELAGEMLKASQAEDDVRDILVQAADLDTTNLNANFQAGYLHLITIRKEEAAKYLLRVYRQRPTYRFDLEFQIGQSFHYGLEFDKAIEFYNRYKTTYQRRGGSYQGKDKIPLQFVDRKIYECNNGKKFVANAKPYAIINMGPQINSEAGDYAPVLNEKEDEIIFTSRRLDGNINENVFSDNKPHEDIFTSSKVNGKWTRASNIGRTVNIPDHNSNLAISADGKTLLTFRSDNGGDIFISEMKPDGTWSQPKPLPGQVNTPDWEASCSLSADGTTLYFASERPGGYGGIDLYIATKDNRGNWGRVKNLGPKINTSGHEDSPFIDYSGKKLFFSSEGHVGMGGYDIYETTLLNASKNDWSEPVNLGYPINTADNDIYYVGTSDGKRGYYASIREDGLGYLDIYAIIPKDMIKDPSAVLPVNFVVKVIDAKTNAPLDATVELLSLSDSKSVPIKTQTKGNYTFTVTTKDPKKYRLSVKHEGYFPQIEEITLHSASMVEKTENKTVGMAASQKTLEILPLRYEVKVVDAKTNTALSASVVKLESISDKISINPISKGGASFEFSIISTNPKSYSLVVDCPGYETQTQTVNLEGAGTVEKIISNTIKLVEAKKVPVKYVVTLIDAKTNKPIDGDVKLISVVGKTTIPAKVTGVGSYEFVLSSATAADYTLSVSKEGYTSQSSTVNIEGMATTEKVVSKSVSLSTKPIEIVVPPKQDPIVVSCTLSVKVLDSKTNKPIEAKLRLEANGESPVIGTTNKVTGVYDFVVKPTTTKEFSLLIESNGYTSKTEKFTIDAAGTVAKNTTRTILLTSVPPVETEVPVPSIKLTVNVVDKSTQSPIDDANVIVQSAIENKEVVGKAMGSGVYVFYITSTTTKNYKLSVDKEGYVFLATQLRIEGAKAGVVDMIKTISLNAISVGATSVMRNLFFDLGRATIQAESHPELNAFVNMMKKNPSVKVEIAGHTDNVGDDNFNLRLSLLRANAVKSYLVSKGISATRISTKGYGETRPLVSNDDEIGGREINRRVELKILSK